MPTYDTSTGLRALKGDSAVRDVDAGFLALATDTAALVAALVPAASLIATAASSAPTGWLLCDGSAISRSTYSALFAAIGETYGPGNGSTTFNVPDFRGRVPVGADGAAGRLTSNDALGNSGGEEKHQLTAAELPSEQLTPDTPVGMSFIVGTTITNVSAQSGSGQPVVASLGTSSVRSNTSPLGSDAPHNNMPPYQVVNWLIKI